MKTIMTPNNLEIKKLTQEQVENLISLRDCQNLIVGSFAKIEHLKRKSSLIFITRNETINNNIGVVSYIECNIYNGSFHSLEWEGTYVKSTYANGGEFWKCLSNNLQPIV